MTYPTTLDEFTNVVDDTDDVMAIDINELQEAIESLEAKVGITSSVVTASLDYKVNNFFATGRKLYLYENTAPTGWSIVGVADKVLAVKGGSKAYNVNGGNVSGTWTQPNHRLVTAEIPAHYHTYSQYTASGGVNGLGGTGGGTKNTGSTGGGGNHYHGTVYRPYAAVGIIVEKN